MQEHIETYRMEVKVLNQDLLRGAESLEARAEEAYLTVVSRLYKAGVTGFTATKTLFDTSVGGIIRNRKRMDGVISARSCRRPWYDMTYQHLKNQNLSAVIWDFKYSGLDVLDRAILEESTF